MLLPQNRLSTFVVAQFCGVLEETLSSHWILAFAKTPQMRRALLHRFWLSVVMAAFGIWIDDKTQFTRKYNMEPRFTRGEYWLLETVVEHELEICALIDNDLALRLNKKGHGLTRNALVETFYRLLSSGLIYAKNEATGFILTLEQIELALDEPKRWVGIPVDERKVTYYGLTQEGGAQW